MRRTLIALIALLISPALAAQPPLYTYVFAVQAPYDAGSWSIWPGNNHLTSMFGKHFLLAAPQCDIGQVDAGCLCADSADKTGHSH